MYLGTMLYDLSYKYKNLYLIQKKSCKCKVYIDISTLCTMYEPCSFMQNRKFIKISEFSYVKY